MSASVASTQGSRSLHPGELPSTGPTPLLHATLPAASILLNALESLPTNRSTRITVDAQPVGVRFTVHHLVTVTAKAVVRAGAFTTFNLRQPVLLRVNLHDLSTALQVLVAAPADAPSTSFGTGPGGAGGMAGPSGMTAAQVANSVPVEMIYEAEGSDLVINLHRYVP